MKTSSIPFAQLRRLLKDLQFEETRKAKGWRFDHPPSETVFLFRPYRLDEKVNVPDLVATRTQLDWRGLLSSEAFEDRLNKAPA
jgi:hypothetical protein